MGAPNLARRVLAEALGTGLLVVVVVGSGIMASRLSPGDVGLQLLENSIATALALPVLILAFGPVSGAHFNPAVSLADWWLGRTRGTGLRLGELASYIGAQLAGGVLGAILANVMFDLRAVQLSTHERTTPGLWIGEVVATGGLIVLVFALARTGRAGVSPAAVGAYIGAAYWFTSSTSFANPAVTVARAFTDTFAGIAPGSVPGFIAAQLVGLVVGVVLLLALYPEAERSVGGVAAAPVRSPASVAADPGPAVAGGDRHRVDS
jgi:arsenate reductase